LSYRDKYNKNISPLGVQIQDITRLYIGNISYRGTSLYYYQNKSYIALIFNNRPYVYTKYVLNILEKYNIKATFFIIGNNIRKRAK
ncbi:hypothetical protein F5882DRAFT_311320, partial [Hyaloscypha sp. PMI_1271]